MLNRSKAILGFDGLVGFESPANPSYQIVSAERLKSDSGLYYTDNPLVKIQYIKDTQDYSDISDSNFNSLLKSINDRAVIDILSKVHNKPDFIDRTPLYRYANNKVETENLPGGFKGYKLILNQSDNLAFEISRIFLEFSQDVAFTLYLFNSAKQQAVKSKDVTATAGIHKEDLNWVLDNTDSYYKGEYYIGYFSNDPLPYKRDYEYSDIMSAIKGLWIEAVNFPDATGTSIFNLENDVSSDLCFGMNPDITVYNDYTDQSIQNKSLFAKAIQLQGQINILSSYIATQRTNRVSRITKEMVSQAVVELEGRDAEGITMVGLKDKLKGEVNHITSEINKLKENYYKKGLITNTGICTTR